MTWYVFNPYTSRGHVFTTRRRWVARLVAAALTQLTGRLYDYWYRPEGA